MFSSCSTTKNLSTCFPCQCTPSRFTLRDPSISDWELGSVGPAESHRSESPTNSAHEPSFSATQSQTRLPKPTIPAASTASQTSAPERSTKTPPPRAVTHESTASNTLRTSRLPSHTKQSGRGSANQTFKSPAKIPAGLDQPERLSLSSAPSYDGSDSDNSSLRSLRERAPTIVVENRMSTVLGLTQSEAERTETGRGTTMSGVEVGGPGSVSPVQSPTPVHPEGFDRFPTDWPLPSTSRSQISVKPRTIPPSGLHDHASSLPPVQTKFAGLPSPYSVPLKERARPESAIFSKNDQPNIRRE